MSYKSGSNYQDQGGNKWVVGGTLQVDSGATFSVATPFTLTSTAAITGNTTFGEDGTGVNVIMYGDTSGKYAMWSQATNMFAVNGLLQIGEGVAELTSAVYMGGGNASDKLSTATANKNILAFYTESTATTGDSRGLYLRHYAGGTISASGFSDAIRAFMTVTGTNYDFASGIHATMQINAGATVSGSAAGARATLAAAAESRTLTGALAALQVDSDIGANNTVPARCALIRMSKSGSVDVPFALDIADDQCLQGAAAAGAGLDALKVILPNGTTGYINIIALS
jgi:hypothetical protein